MKLGDLAFACHIFGSTSGYNKSYEEMLLATRPRLDFHSALHMAALLKWLNAWGCRQFAKRYHQAAIKAIGAWYDTSGCMLSNKSPSLLNMGDDEIQLVAKAFGALADQIASLKRRASNDTKYEITIGPTGASKILFAWKPSAAVPWDGAMRVHYGFDGSPACYAAFLAQCQQDLQELARQCAAAGFDIVDLPQMLERANSPLTKLLDEYHWVTITRGCAAPGGELLRRWVAWS